MPTEVEDRQVEVRASSLGETQRVVLERFSGTKSIRQFTVVDCQERLTEAQVAGAMIRLLRRGLLAQVAFRNGAYFYRLTKAGKRVARELKATPEVDHGC